MYILKKIMKSKKGQTLVETALILPVVLLILLGIVEFGRLFCNYLVVSNASREGARYASLSKTDAEVKQKINELVSAAGISQDDITISFSNGEDIRIPGESIEVRVDYDHNLITPIVGPIISDSGVIKLTSATRMRVE